MSFLLLHCEAIIKDDNALVMLGAFNIIAKFITLVLLKCLYIALYYLGQ
ncbi:MAG: hypothetical protein ACI9N1_002092, partial [Flavobacteriales bacterium]